MPKVLRALVGVLPSFIGFAFLGICLFYVTYRFQDIGYASICLFAMMNGDELSSTFRELTAVSMFISQIYLYSFIIFSMWVIQNIFCVIIEDGYMTTKYEGTKYDFMQLQEARE